MSKVSLHIDLKVSSKSKERPHNFLYKFTKQGKQLNICFQLIKHNIFLMSKYWFCLCSRWDLSEGLWVLVQWSGGSGASDSSGRSVPRVVSRSAECAQEEQAVAAGPHAGQQGFSEGVLSRQEWQCTAQGLVTFHQDTATLAILFCGLCLVANR